VADLVEGQPNPTTSSLVAEEDVPVMIGAQGRGGVESSEWGDVIPGFMSNPSTHRMHDPGSIVPHIRPKVFTDNQIS
jgi:hypothetical protein